GDMCGGKRKRPPSESDIEDDVADDSEPSKGPKQPLLSDLPPSMEPVTVTVVASPQAQAKMADDEAKPKGRKKKGKASRNEEQEKPGLAKAGPQGGPLLPPPAEPAAQANTDPEPGASNASLEFRPLRSSLAEFAPPPKPQAPEPEAVRRV